MILYLLADNSKLKFEVTQRINGGVQDAER
jgi:hypothetical protein